MHYEVSKDGFTFQSLLNLQTFEVFQGSHSRPILNHAFDFWLAENILNFLGKMVRPKLDQPDQFHHLAHDITESQKEQFLALMSHYSCMIAKNSNDLAILK